MSFYCIRGYNRAEKRIYFMTARGLYNRIINDSNKSNYNWIAPASELVRIIRKPNFPYDYAKGIMICILNCFASLETQKEYPSVRESGCEEAILYCYNELLRYPTDSEAQEARRNYFKALLNSIFKYNDQNDIRIPYHFGNSYYNLVFNWKKTMEMRYFKTEPEESLIVLKSIMRKEFNNIIENAEKNGVFDEDDKKFWENFMKNK